MNDHAAMNQLRELHMRGFMTLVTFRPEDINGGPILLPQFQPAFYTTRDDVLHQLLKDREELARTVRAMACNAATPEEIDAMIERFKDV